MSKNTETLNSLTEEDLYSFLEEHGNNRVKRELLAFWGRHPDAKFSRLVICYALDCSKLETKGTLKLMVEKGLLDENSTNNGVTLYSLTRNEEKRRPVLELAALEWDNWQVLLRRIGLKDNLVKEIPCRKMNHQEERRRVPIHS